MNNKKVNKSDQEKESSTTLVQGGQIYCTHPTHGPAGYLGPCRPGINNPQIGKDWEAHVQAFPAHTGFIQAQPCTI